LSIVFALERTNQLSLLPDKDLVDLCPPIESYQVTKNSELYAILSAFPAKPRLSPQLVQQLIKENLDAFEIISLTIDDYQAVIDLMVTLNLSGGAIYDALIAQASLKAEVDHLLTLNLKHFVRLGERIEQISIVPRSGN
jgi:predicted nucleic acid-binding protein